MLFTPDDDFYDAPDLWDLPDCAVALVTRGGSWSARNQEDGFVPESMIARFTSDPVQAVRVLASRKVLHRAKGGVRFSDWARWARALGFPAEGDDQAQREQTPAARRQALFRDPALKQAIRERDCDRCRYCGIAVRWGKGRAGDSGAYDCIDPRGFVSPGNVVVACMACREAKGDRTPEQAGMKVLDAPAGHGDPPEGRSVSRNASRNASFEETAGQKRYGNSTRNASGEEPQEGRNASRNASPGKTARRKRHGSPARNASGSVTGTDRSDLDLDQSLALASQSKSRSKSRAPEPEPGTPEFRTQVQAEMAERGYGDVTDAEADAIAAEVLGCAKDPVPHPLGYVLKAVKDEKNPAARWLSARAPAPAVILAAFSPATKVHEFSLNRETGACADCKRDRVDKIHPRQKATA